MTDPRLTEIAALRAHGMTLREIADRLGCSSSWVHRLLAQTPHAPDQASAAARFPGFPRGLAARLDQRYPDEAALAAASDDELLGLPGLGPWRLMRLRQRTERRAWGAHGTPRARGAAGRNEAAKV